MESERQLYNSCVKINSR